MQSTFYFTHQKNPFVFDDIEYKNVSAATEYSPRFGITGKRNQLQTLDCTARDPHALEAIPVFKAREMIARQLHLRYHIFF